ncbi:hypothetical protein D083_1079 [Dickeya solani RNS 08.23.3.1.A]|nr:hypothetical protein D083_1079 [Dickeya solani RNS 08.23.3.1.A]
MADPWCSAMYDAVGCDSLAIGVKKCALRWSKRHQQDVAIPDTRL